VRRTLDAKNSFWGSLPLVLKQIQQQRGDKWSTPLQCDQVQESTRSCFFEPAFGLSGHREGRLWVAGQRFKQSLREAQLLPSAVTEVAMQAL
jgi:hypothetical protein